jgi:hypothetical protein
MGWVEWYSPDADEELNAACRDLQRRFDEYMDQDADAGVGVR